MFSIEPSLTFHESSRKSNVDTVVDDNGEARILRRFTTFSDRREEVDELIFECGIKFFVASVIIVIVISCISCIINGLKKS